MRNATLARTQGQILVVDPDAGERDLLRVCFEGAGFAVTTAQDGRDARAHLASQQISLIVLELALPDDDDGIAFIREIRGRSPVPIVVVTGTTKKSRRIDALAQGADDIVIKPIDADDLVARVRAVLRRTIPMAAGGFHDAPAGFVGAPAAHVFDDWTIDLGRRLVTAPGGRTVALTTDDFDVLAVFVAAPRRFLTRGDIAGRLGLVAPAPDSRLIDNKVSRLRKALDAVQPDPPLIQTVRGKGYMFTPVVRPKG